MELGLDLKTQVRELVDEAKNDFKLRFREFHPTGFDEQLERCAEALPAVLVTASFMPHALSEADLERYINIHFMAVCQAAGEDLLHMIRLDTKVVENILPSEIIRGSKTFRYFTPSHIEQYGRINALGYLRTALASTKHDQMLDMAFKIYLMGFALWHGASQADLRFISNRHNDLRWALVIRGNIKQAIEELL